ncbi:hypothetical protein [Lysobacter sp. F6437]|uniref:hypothetical protein n=1 Tax=Lysobacter sp. F6437 TaxID=3459296 RepID=UPI00403DC32C
MARIRSIKPEFWTSEQIAECSPNARLLFIGLWTFSDDNGIHPASIPRLKMEIFPADDFSRADVAAMVEELVRNRLLREYVVQGEQFWQITGWNLHQKIDQPTFKHPLPDGSLPTNVRRRVTEQGSANKVQRTPDERSPPERRGEERSGKEEADYVLSPDGEQGQAAPSNVSQHPASQRLCSIVLDAYHRVLPNCQSIAVLNPKRQRRIQLADKLARQVCKQQGWPYEPEDFWTSYFGECTDDPWLRGEVPNPNNPRWKQNLDVLLAEDRFAGIMDKAIAAMKSEAA